MTEDNGIGMCNAIAMADASHFSNSTTVTVIDQFTC